MSKKDTAIKVHEMVGAIKMGTVMANVVNASKYAFYKQIKDTKAHSALDMTWAEFCSSELGKDRKTIEAEIKLMEEYGESFMLAIERMGLKKRDLNVLGSGLSDDAKAAIRNGVIEIDGRTFNLSELDDNMEEFTEALTEYTKSLKTKQAELKSSRKVNEMHHKTIDKLHKEIEEDKGKTKEQRLSETEEAFLDDMEALRRGFDGYMVKMEPGNMDELKKSNRPTDRMKIAYLETLGYIAKQANLGIAKASDMYAEPGMDDGTETWKPRG